MGNVPPQKDGHDDSFHRGGARGSHHSQQAYRQPAYQQQAQQQQQQQQQPYHHQAPYQHQQQTQQPHQDHYDYRNQRNVSDHSMNSNAQQQAQQQQQQDNQSAGGYTQGSNNVQSSDAGANESNLNLDLLSIDDDKVPTVFRWEHGGRQVYITGTFNGWSRQIPMHRSGNDFTYIHNLNRGKHAFKFIVDDEWRFAPDQPTVADIEGRINNFIDVSDFHPYTGDKHFEERLDGVIPCLPPTNTSTTSGPESKLSMPGSAASGVLDATGPGSTATKESTTLYDQEEGFGNTMPDIDEYTKEPPPLPPHLRHIILNKPPQLNDTAALPVPQHVALNHLYCTAIKDNMMVLGCTQRFKTKFVTTVYYSPCAS